MAAGSDQPAPDPAAIEAHLEALFGAPGDLHDGLIEIAHGKDGPATAKLFTIDELSEAAEYAATVNRAGDQVYVGGALRKPGYTGHKSKITGRWTLRAEREHVYGSNLLWADADDRATLDHAVTEYRRACAPDLIVITGTIPEHRAQFWWRLDDPVTDLDRLEATLIGIAKTLGTDTVVDAPRVMRLAGTVNWPRKPGRAAELVTMRWRNGADSHTAFFAAWRAYGSVQPEPATTTVQPAAAPTIHSLTGRLDLMAAITAAAVTGKWHETVLRVVASLAGLGRTDDEILLICRAFTQPGYTVAQTDHDVSTMLRGARAKGWTPDVTVVQTAPIPPRRERPRDLPDLPETIVPIVLLDYARERAETMQVPLEYLVVPMLVAAGNIIAGRLAIRPRKSDWLVTTNLWGAIVGPPGALKSPAINAALKPLRRVEHAAWQAHKTALDNWEQAGKQGPQPRPRRFSTNDITEAKLGDLLADNPNGVLLARDELTGWLSHMADPQRSGERQLFLEAWNGLSPYVQDRIGRGTVRIDRLCVGIFGGLQPEVFERDFLERAEQNGNDGLIQRFQLLVWPAISKEWRNVDRWPEQQHIDRVESVFARLADIEPDTIGAIHPGDPCAWVKFSPAGQEVFDHFLGQVESAVRSDKLPRFVDGHVAKFRSLMPALALLLQMVEQPVRFGSTEVGEHAATMALGWCEFLRKTALRIYAMPEQRRSDAALALAEAVRDGRVGAVRNRPGGEFTARDIVRLRLARLDKGAVQECLDQLVEDGILAVREVRGQGRGGKFRFYQTV